MQVKDLSSELNIQNKDLIAFLKDKGFKVSSHMQNVTDEMIELAREQFPKKEEEIVEEVKEEEPIKKTKKEVPERPIKKFDLNDMISCKSVVPYHLVTVGNDGRTVYNWEYYGDVEYVRYGDLQGLRRKKIVTAPLILIEDADLCYQWRRELGDTYKYYLTVDYLEEFFDLSDDKFEELLKDAPATLKDVIEITAMSMIRNENYPSVKKIKIIDEVLGTCISEFLM